MAIMRPRRAAATTILLYTAVSTGVLGGDEKLFSHKIHLEEGAECTDCHDTTKNRPVPKREACNDCHDTAPLEWKLPVRALRLKAEFPHPIHAKSIACKDCHEKTAKDSQSAEKPAAAWSDCNACHQEKGIEVAEKNCAACHALDQRTHPPADHQQAWRIRHGQESQWRVFERHGQDCALCHRTAACLNCHRNNRPQSHTALWRMRTHGFAASWDRDRCKTCHQTNSCVRCHLSTAPMNHRGAWNATHGLAAQTKGQRHCLACHSKGWCAACHAGK